MNNCNHEYNNAEYNLNKNWILLKCELCGNITSEIMTYYKQKLLRVFNNE